MYTIRLMRGFLEDKRPSMNYYSDSLYRSACNLIDVSISLEQFTPHEPFFAKFLPIKFANLRMRVLRYIYYPLIALIKSRVDLIHVMDHSYSHILYFAGSYKKVITVHDVIPLLASRGLIEGIPKTKRSILFEFTSLFFKHADIIISVSNSTRNDLVKYCRCDPNNIKVIRLGISDIFKPQLDIIVNEFKIKYNFPLNGYIILITGHNHYKNHITSIKIFENLQKKIPNLYLVRLGPFTTEWQGQINKVVASENIINIDELGELELPILYASVDCLLFPSLYEGFGWPPLEAMACGTPVVTSNIPVLMETVEGAALTASPLDVEGLSKHIISLFSNELLRKKMIKNGYKRAKEFSWSKSTSEVLRIYKNLLKK